MLPELGQLRVKLNIVLMNHSQVSIDGHNLQLQTTEQTDSTSTSGSSVCVLEQRACAHIMSVRG